MKLHETAKRLAAFVAGRDHWHHRPVHPEVVQRTHAAGLAGTTVLHDLEDRGNDGQERNR
jgi:PII-like signaling protein